MTSSLSIGSSENALVINLEKAQLEEIVEKKLNHFFSEKKIFFEKNVFRHFYSPVEQALVEMALDQRGGNQLKASELLGINRNTLKKKLDLYGINIKALLMQKRKNPYPVNRIFLSSLASFDLLSACRSKLAWAERHKQIPKEKILKPICQPVERRIIQTALGYCRGNQIRTSRLLGLNRNTLKKKMNEDLNHIKACL